MIVIKREATNVYDWRVVSTYKYTSTSVVSNHDTLKLLLSWT